MRLTNNSKQKSIYAVQNTLSHKDVDIAAALNVGAESLAFPGVERDLELQLAGLALCKPKT